MGSNGGHIAQGRADTALREVVARLSAHMPVTLREPPFNAKALWLGAGSFRAEIATPLLGVYLYRIHEERIAARGMPERSDIPLSLHFLLVAMADDPEIETKLIGWGMKELAQTPVLATADGDNIQILPDELPIETLMQIWSAMRAPYRLCAPYLLRIA